MNTCAYKVLEDEHFFVCMSKAEYMQYQHQAKDWMNGLNMSIPIDWIIGPILVMMMLMGASGLVYTFYKMTRS